MVKEIQKTSPITVKYSNGQERQIYYELHMRDNEDPSVTAEFYRENFSNKYWKYLRKDKHHYDNKFAVKKDLIGFAYVVAKDVETDQVIGFCACDVFPRKYKGKDIVATGTHCLCSLPKITDESSPDLGGRGCHLAQLTIKTLYDTVFEEFDIDVDFEICNEFSNKAYCTIPNGENWTETGVFRVNKDGERCQIRSERWFK